MEHHKKRWIEGTGRKTRSWEKGKRRRKSFIWTGVVKPAIGIGKTNKFVPASMYNNKKHEWQSQSAHHWYLSHCSLARLTFKLMIRLSRITKCLSPKCCMSGAYWAWRRELWAVSSFVFHKPRPWSIENWRAFKLWRFQNGKRKKRLNSKPSIYSSSQNGARRARWPWRSKLSITVQYYNEEIRKERKGWTTDLNKLRLRGLFL